MKIIDINILKKTNFLILLVFPVFFILGNSFVNLGVIILTFSAFLLYLFNKLNPFSKVENILYSIFFFYISINSLINYTEFNNFLKSLALFRYIFFSAAIVYTLKNTSFEQLKKIKYLYLFIIFFVILDIIFQYFSGSDIFGFKPAMCEEAYCLRYQGPFGKELIAGSFFAYFGLVVILFFFKDERLNYLLLVLGVVILITGDRSPFITYIIFFTIYIIISNQKFIKKFFLFFLSVIIFLSTINTLKSTKMRYVDFLKNISYSEISKFEKEKNLKNFLEDARNSPWGKHYQVALAMFLEKPILGHGYNSFRIKCSSYEQKTKTNTGTYKGCSTHPHNSFLQILSEQGLIGFLILSAIILCVLKRIFTLKFKKKNVRIKFVLSAILFLCFYFPLKPTGSLFSSWLGSITFFTYSFYLFFLDKNKSHN
jgi:O-antigen ligase